MGLLRAEQHVCLNSSFAPFALLAQYQDLVINMFLLGVHFPLLSLSPL